MGVLAPAPCVLARGETLASLVVSGPVHRGVLAALAGGGARPALVRGVGGHVSGRGGRHLAVVLAGLGAVAKASST
eukprot:15713487-Heterocapsa_arctica.AAC.1